MTTLVPPETTVGRASATHAVHTLRRRPIVWLAGGTALIVLAGLLLLTVPVPLVEGFLGRLVTNRVRAQVACPGVLTRPPTVTLGGGRLLPQVIRKRLTEVKLSVPDATLSGVPHASFAATLYNVSQPTAARTHADRMDAAITVGFADLPVSPGAARPTFHRAADGGLTVDAQVPASASNNVRAKLYMRMQLQGESVRSVPERLQIFGITVPAAQVTELTGGVRTQKLPTLPAGLTYRSVTPRSDGLHVELAGVSTTALNKLPTDVGGRTVSYSAGNGLLGISSSIIKLPLTIFTAPRLDGTKLTLVPRSVRFLGKDRPVTAVLSKLVLSQVDQTDLTRQLPVLPSGVHYQSVSVDASGIKVVVSGVTVKPFSALQQPADGRPTTFGAENGLLTATAAGGGSDKPTPIVLHAQPKIVGTTLNIAPQQIEMFGARFPAANVLAQVKAQQTTFPLQALPANLAYQNVRVLDDGLLIRLAGTDVTLAKGALTGATC